MGSDLWKPEYSVGDETIDEQHQQFFQMIAQLKEAIKTGDAEQEVIGTLQDLLGYLRNHFTFEEHYMERGGYPDLAAHRQEHADFTLHASAYIHSYLSNQKVEPAELLAYLEKWFINHILGSDHKYMYFFKTNCAE